MVLTGEVIDVAVHLEIAVPTWELGVGFSNHVLLVDAEIVLQGLNGDKYQIMLLGKALQLLGSHHLSVLCHNLTADAALGQACQAAQVHGCLGMALACKDSTSPSNQWEGMSWAAKLIWPSLSTGTGADGVSSLLCGDACCGVD